MTRDEDTQQTADADRTPRPAETDRGTEQQVGDGEGDGDERATERPTPDTLERRVAELAAELERERTAATDYMQRWQRAQADLANVRRRMQTEQEQRERLATGRTLALLLPALDNFERAFSTLPQSLRGYSWISGLALIEMQLQGALSANGARPIAAEPGQPFNPQQHEAVGEIETAEHPAGSVGLVLQRGYELEGVLLRPALVQLAKAPLPASAASAAQEPSPHPAAEAPPSDAATKEEAS